MHFSPIGIDARGGASVAGKVLTVVEKGEHPFELVERALDVLDRRFGRHGGALLSRRRQALAAG